MDQSRIRPHVDRPADDAEQEHATPTRTVGGIAIFSPYAHVELLDSVYDLAGSLVDEGYDVEFFVSSREARSGEATAAGPRFTFRYWRHPVIITGSDATSPLARLIGPDAGIRRAIRGTRFARLIRRLWGLGSQLRVPTAGRDRVAALGDLDLRHRENPYVCAVGIDPEGLISAGEVASRLRVPLVYHSLEILLADEADSRSARALKRREVDLSRTAAMVIVQDEDRARLLAEENGLSGSVIELLPNAPRGPARRSRSDWWSERLDIPSDRRILLHTGSIGPWTGISEIASASASLPDPWVLVIHCGQAASDPWTMNTLRDLGQTSRPGKVYISALLIDREQYQEAIDGADIGVAFYVPGGDVFSQQNIRTIGLSSGKVSNYLRSGLPLVVNRASSLGALVAEHGIGVSVGQASDLKHALEEISLEYADISARAIDFFNERLDFDRTSATVRQRLMDIVGAEARP